MTGVIFTLKNMPSSSVTSTVETEILMLNNLSDRTVDEE